jgi:hypothetical protein
LVINTTPEVLLKTPGEVRKIDIDYTDHPDLASGETIDSIQSSGVTPSGLTIDGTAVSTPIAQVTLSAGTAGIEYTLTVLVNTSDGQKLESVVMVEVRDP